MLPSDSSGAAQTKGEMKDDDLIEQILDEMAPMHKPSTSTPATVMAVRNIIREALLKYEAKVREERDLGDHHHATEN